MAEGFKFTPEQRAEIKRLAVMTAGSGATLSEIGAEVSRIAPLYTPASLADGALESVEWWLKDVEEWRTFSGTVLYVDREISSRRAIIVLKTKPHAEQAPNGQEFHRTGVTADGGVAAALANLANANRGHRVSVRLGKEKFTDRAGKKKYSNVIFDLRVQGADNSYDPNTPIDFQGMKLDPSKLEIASQWATQ